MKTLLVATDFSRSAINAANYAAEMALRIKANLMLLHVYQVPAGYLEIPIPVNPGDMLLAAERQISDLKEELSKKTNNKLQITTDVSMGSFFTELHNAIHPAFFSTAKNILTILLPQ